MLEIAIFPNLLKIKLKTNLEIKLKARELEGSLKGA